MRTAAYEIAECAFVLAMDVFDLTHPDALSEEAARWADDLFVHYFGCQGFDSLELLGDREIRRRAKLMMQDLTDRL